MPSIEVKATGLVYRNDKPHLRSRHAYFPSLVELGPRRLACAFDMGSAFEATDVRSYVSHSQDGGQTWTPPALMFEPDTSRHLVSTTCRISTGPDHSLIGLACMFDRSLPEEGLANPVKEGFVRTEMAMIRSTDDGVTWSPPQTIVPPIDWRHFETCSPILVLPSGRWMMPTSFWSDWEGRCPHGANTAIALLSDDRGHNWSRVTKVMGGPDDGFTGWEQKQIVLADGRLMALCWCFDYSQKANIPNRYAFSLDGGSTYERSLSTPLQGETCTPVALPNGYILCVYRRMDRRGLWAHLARIRGDAWEPLAEALLWGPQVEAHRTDGSSTLGQMSTLRFGCPSVRVLADGDVMAAFWCVEDGVSNIRWYRLGVAC